MVDVSLEEDHVYKKIINQSVKFEYPFCAFWIYMFTGAN